MLEMYHYALHYFQRAAALKYASITRNLLTLDLTMFACGQQSEAVTRSLVASPKPSRLSSGRFWAVDSALHVQKADNR